MKPSLTGASLRHSLLSTATLCTILASHAAEVHWFGGSDANWATAANWQNATLPTADDQITFADDSTQNLSINLGADRTVHGITVANPAGPVAFSNNNLTIGKGGIDLSLAEQNLTLSSGVTIASQGRQTWSVAASRSITAAAIPNKPGTPANNTGVLRIVGPGTVTLGATTTNLILDGQGNPWATVGDNDWAGLDAGVVVPSAYTNVDGTTTTALVGGAVNSITGNVGTANGTDVLALRFNEAAAFDLTVANSGTARTMTARGILVTANSGGGSIGGNLRANAFVRPNRSSTSGSSFNIIQNSASSFTIGANISNGSSNAPTRLVKSGPGKLILLQNNGYTGGTYIDEGIVQFGSGVAPSGDAGNGFPGGGDIVNNGSLVFNRYADVTLIHNISGSGSLVQQGPGVLSLTTSVSTFTGPVRVHGGTLAVTTPNNLGNGSEVVIDGGSFRFLGGFDISNRTVTIGASGASIDTNGFDISFAHSIGHSGSGSLTKTGLGSLTLHEASTHSGGTQIQQGSLLVNNTTGSGTGSGAVAVLNSGTLGGNGNIDATVTVQSGGKISPGTGVGELNVDALHLLSGASVDIEFDSGNDTIVVESSDGLQISNTSVRLLQASSGNAYNTPGVYTLFHFQGALGGDGIGGLSVANPQPGYNYSFSTSGSSVILTISVSGVVSDWNNAGGGSWADAGNWNGGIPDAQSATANFSLSLGAPATVTLDGTRTVGAVTFLSSNHGYTIAAGSGGQLIFNNGSNGASILDGAGQHTITAPLTLQSDIEIETAHAADSLTLSGTVSGATTLTKTGPGSLALLAPNSSLTGAVELQGGKTTFAEGGLGIGSLLLDNTTLVWAADNFEDITAGRSVTFGNQPVVFDVQDNDVDLGSDFGGSGSATLTKLGSGRLSLLADTTFPGDVTIQAGTLSLGNGGAEGNVSGNIQNFGHLRVHRSDTTTLAAVISGTGSFTQEGAGITNLGAANTFSGLTRITSGQLRLSHSLALQNSTLRLENGGGTLDTSELSAATLGGLEGDLDLSIDALALTFGGNNAATTYSGAFVGSGSVTKTGSAYTTLLGGSAIDGALTVTGGANTGGLELGGGASFTADSLTVTGNSQLRVNGGTFQASGLSSLSNAGTTIAVLNLTGGEVHFDGGLQAISNANIHYVVDMTGGVFSATSLDFGRTALNYSTEPAAGADNAGFYLRGGSASISGNVLLGSNNGANSSVSLRVDGGDMTIDGILSVGLNNGGRWSIVDVQGGTLTNTDVTTGIQLGGPFVGNAVLSVSGGVVTAERIQLGQNDLAGTHLVRLAGSGQLYVGSGGIADGSVNDAGSIRLAGGVLAAKADWSTSLPVDLAGAAEVLAADSVLQGRQITLDGPVSGTGSLTKSGAGILHLNGTIHYAGSTTVAEGTLRLAHSGLNDTASVSIESAGSLQLDFDDTDVVGSFRLNGDLLAAGTYGAIGSGATVETAQITGPGLLRVLPSDPFLAWITGYPSLVGADAEKDADPDHDGLSNLLEFALDSSPISATPSGKIRTRVESVNGEPALTLTLPVRSDADFGVGSSSARIAVVDRIQYRIEGSNNLVNYDETVLEVTPALADDLPYLSTGWSYRTFRLDGAVSGTSSRGPKGFLRADITEVP